tara:strand:+ start:637 stop:873 length:237 start_codon:yes stop_codon:yes gene_type:complete
MRAKFDKSEDFRAQILFTGGFALCTPFGIILTGILETGNCNNWGGLTASIALFLLGLTFISRSYDIMCEKDKFNVIRR